jgi:hypothetical protein
MSEAIAAFLGAVIGSTVTAGGDWIAYRFTTRQRAAYLTIRVVNELDPFVDKCALVAIDDGALSRGLPDRIVDIETPEAPRFPDDLDWRSIDPQIAFNLLSLNNKLEQARRDVGLAMEYAETENDLDQYYDTRRNAFAKLGIEAAEIGRGLRETYGLPRRSFDRWNPEEELKSVRASFEKKERAAKQQKAGYAATDVGDA